MLPIFWRIKRFISVAITFDKIRWTAWKNLLTILQGLAVRRGRIGGQKMSEKPIMTRIVRKRSRPSVVNTRKKGWTEHGTVKNLIGNLAPHARGHSVTNMFSHPNPTPESLRRLGRERRIIDLAADWFHP